MATVPADSPRYTRSGITRSGAFGLALQLPSCIEVRALSCSLVSSTPERPCDDVRGSDSLSSESDGDAADFLDRPADQRRRGDALVFAVVRHFVFFDGGGLARWRIAAIMAKASITRETWRCHPCQDLLSL